MYIHFLLFYDRAIAANGSAELQPMLLTPRDCSSSTGSGISGCGNSTITADDDDDRRLLRDPNARQRTNRRTIFSEN
jgi:hypothetical protein